jgi:chemotaxis protein MotB
MRKPDRPRELKVRSWQLSFNDLLTILLTFFILLVSMSNINMDRIRAASSAAAAAFGAGKMDEKQAALIRSLNTIPGVEVQAAGSGVSVVLPESFLYQSGSAEIIRKDVLRTLGDKLKAAGGSIRVEGHTDNIPIAHGSFPSNWELSTQRAVNVVKYLADVCGMNPQKLSAAGYADSRSIASNDTPEGRARNRRVNIIISLQ